jgi:RNA polymerase subunit RPABC4/transcription elongation factor Spt4
MGSLLETLRSAAYLALADGQSHCRSLCQRCRAILKTDTEICSICPGRHFADAALWMTVATILCTFDITSALDKSGRKIDVNYAREPAPSFLR